MSVHFKGNHEQSVTCYAPLPGPSRGGHVLDFGVNLQKSSAHPELLLVAMCGDHWVWSGLLSVKAKTMSHLRLDSQHLAKSL